MITEAKLFEHKWRKVEDKCWEKLGVRIEYPIIRPAYNVIKIIYYQNIKQGSYFATCIPVDASINALETTIRSLIKFIFSARPEIHPMTPKQKRTLKNWIL